MYKGTHYFSDILIPEKFEAHPDDGYHEPFCESHNSEFGGDSILSGLEDLKMSAEVGLESSVLEHGTYHLSQYGHLVHKVACVKGQQTIVI
jgi:hypothetical protein